MQLEKEEIQEAIDEQIVQAEKKYGKEIKLTLINIISLLNMLNPKDNEVKKARLIPLSQWNEFHQFPTIPALRQYAFRRETNGFDEVLEYGGENGKTLYINEDKFFEWYYNRHKKKQA